MMKKYVRGASEKERRESEEEQRQEGGGDRDKGIAERRETPLLTFNLSCHWIIAKYYNYNSTGHYILE